MSRRFRLAAALVLVALAGALAAVEIGGHPARPAGLEVALQDNAVFLHRYYYDRATALRQARALGVSWLRVTLLWSRVAPVPAAARWQWAQYDDLVAAARSHGLHLELTISGPAPAWATGDHRVGVVRPNATDFGRFAAAAAARFRGRVERWSIWNEPNYVTWLEPQAQAPRLYRALYTAAYAAIRRADPHAGILIGETAGPAQPGAVIPALRFIREVACRDDKYRPLGRCAPLVADGYAHHPYDFLYPPDHAYPDPDAVTMGSLGRLTAALDRLARVHALASSSGHPLDVYLTEFGYMTPSHGGPPEEVRARYLTRAFDNALAHYPRVRQLLQYLLVDPPPGFPGGQFDTGLVAQDGAETTSYRALARWASAAERGPRIAAP